VRRYDVATLRAAFWTLKELERFRRVVRREGIEARVVRPPRRPPPAGARGVHGVLRRRNATCLERALLLQAWYAAQGIERDVVIGVTAPATGFTAHAWLDGEPAEQDGPFRELHRLAP
jgi:Transglutaminase-like superfamily